MSGYVYFAKVGQYIKVGHSRDPERRVRNLFQSATRYALPADLTTDAPRELIATIPGGLGMERACHAALDDFAAGGEFFIDEPPVREFIRDAVVGRFSKVSRVDGVFIPPSRMSIEDRAKLKHALDHMFDRVFNKAAS